MKYADFIREDRRLEILLFLAATAGFGASQYLLREAIDRKGHAVSMDQLKGDLTWLYEQDLIDLHEQDGALIAKLRQRGLDVSQGRVVHPGVKRPQPE